MRPLILPRSVHRLTTRLDKVEKEVSQLAKAKRLIEEKYSVSLTYAQVIHTRASPDITLPKVPDLIAADFILATKTSI